MGQTSNFGFETSDDGTPLRTRDGNLIDFLLKQIEQHHHTGALAEYAPVTAPALTLDETGGDLPGGTRVYYRFTFVDEDGQESAVSPAAFVDTPAAIDAPGAPTLTYETTGGTLEPGNYFYVLSAYEGSSLFETLAVTARMVTVPTGTSTNEITIELPELPDGADGFNIFRRAPGQSHYSFLDEVDMTVATPPDVYVDDGGTAVDPLRLPPLVNNTHRNYSVDIELQEQPAIDYTWKLYRSYDDENWVETYLAAITDLEGATPMVILTYSDDGDDTGYGSPPFANGILDPPAKINLGTEVDGLLDPSHIDGGVGGDVDPLTVIAVDQADGQFHPIRDTNGVIKGYVGYSDASGPGSIYLWAGDTAVPTDYDGALIEVGSSGSVYIQSEDFTASLNLSSSGQVDLDGTTITITPGNDLKLFSGVGIDGTATPSTAAQLADVLVDLGIIASHTIP